MLSPTDALLIFLAAFAAGTMNAIAGGGTFITLPTLVVVGLPARTATATSAVALWPGSIASVIGYLPEVRSQSGRSVLFAASLCGGVIGASLLLTTGEAVFQVLIPWLMLIATVLFISGPAINRRARRHAEHEDGHGLTVGIVLGQFAIAIYGGYFGAGMGIVILASLAIAGMQNLHQMNALKNCLATAINGVAVITFVSTDLLPTPDFLPWESQSILRWPHIGVMIIGSICGGFAGVKLARSLPRRLTRAIIGLIGVTLTTWFFWHTYR